MKEPSLNEHPVSNYCKDTRIISLAEDKSSSKRQEERDATNVAIDAYTRHIAFCEEYFRKHGENPGGWNRVFALRDAAAKIANTAVSIESQTVIQEEWLKETCDKTWAPETIARLELEFKTLRDYFNTRFERWRSWKENEEERLHKAVEDKKLEFLGRRGSSIQYEIEMVQQLSEYGNAIWSGENLPEPNGVNSEADRCLTLLYRKKLLEA